jgi:arabinofuranan 3-O-arabinosyltransferase
MTSIDQPGKAPLEESFARLMMDPVRLKLVARCWIVLAPIIYLIDLLQQTRDGLSNGLGRPFGDDFVNYWSGPFLALHGRVAEIYDFAAFHAFEQSVTAQSIQYYHYSYPPVMLLLTLPLALIPYVPALGVWLAATWYGFYRALKAASGEGALLLSLATPALFVSAVGGQNGALTAALLCGGLVLLDRRPIVAGILFGCFVYKPHLAVILPFALIAGRRWPTVVAAGATAVLLVAASVAMYGLQCWFDYTHNLGILRAVILEDGAGVSHRMVSMFVFARHVGAGVQTAYAIQAAFAVVAAIVVARSWWRNDSTPVRNALVVMGTCLVTPYLQDYDLVMSVFVAVWLKQAGEQQDSVSPMVIAVAMAAIMLAPFFAAPVAKATGFVLAAPVLVAVFVLLVVLAPSSAGSPATSIRRRMMPDHQRY